MKAFPDLTHSFPSAPLDPCVTAGRGEETSNFELLVHIPIMEIDRSLDRNRKLASGLALLYTLGFSLSIPTPLTWSYAPRR